MSDLSLQPFEARIVIESLRKGAVPMALVQHFTVGRERWLRYLRGDLEDYIAQGGSKVRFINGDYGDGKTHFMSVVRHIARELGFAVSFVVLTREVPLHKFEVVFRELVRELRTDVVGEVGVRALVAAWLARERPEGEAVEALADALRALPGMDLAFANALVALERLHAEPLREGETPEARQEARDLLCRWLEGDRISKRALKPFGIFESLNKTNAKRLLASLIAFLRHLGYQGLVLLMDELETVMAQSSSIRNAAFENVRLLIDSTDQSRHLHIFLSIIPDVLSAEKGFRSYDALWSRVRTLGEGGRLNYRGVLIDLHRTPLGPDEFLELGLRLRDIHAAAFRWDASAVGEALIREICARQEQLGLQSEVRLFIRQIIDALDLAEQGEAAEALPGKLAEARAAVDAEKRAELSPSWDT